MKIGIFKRFIALFLALTVLFSLCITLVACNAGSDSAKPNPFEPDNSLNSGSDNGSNADTGSITIPSDKDYGREATDFDKIEYVKPDFDAIIAKLREVIDAIEKNEISFDDQIAMIVDLEKDYSNILTMRTLADINVAKNSASEYWMSEFEYINGSFPLLTSIIEDMYVAAANSVHAENFEDEYFGDGLIEEYKGGGKYTDELVALFEKEEALEAEYTAISTSDEYSAEELKSKKTEIFIELVKVRRKIADELGYKTYAEHAYETLGRDYSADKASKLLDDICEYILPTYQILSYTTLAKYVYQDGSVTPSYLAISSLVNNSLEIVTLFDESYRDIFCYMLQHNLFDINEKKPNRNDGAFVTYLEDQDSPYLFVSASKDITDYATLIHEFGHFIDAYINYNSDASIDQKEISSQAFEYLSLTRMDKILSESDMRYLSEVQMLNALMTLIFQGFYAKAEELIYALPYEEITKENLDAAVVKAAEAFSLNTKYMNDISAIFITHTFLYPFYVQSYCTSLIPSLEIYFMEIENKGAGFEAYKELIDRNGEDFTLEEALEDAGIASPFKDGIILELAGKILSYVNTGTLPEKNDDGLEGVA